MFRKLSCMTEKVVKNAVAIHGSLEQVFGYEALDEASQAPASPPGLGARPPLTRARTAGRLQGRVPPGAAREGSVHRRGGGQAQAGLRA